MKPLARSLFLAAVLIGGLLVATSAAEPELPTETVIRTLPDFVSCDELSEETLWFFGWTRDFDGDGYVVCKGDCDEGDPEVYPGSPEVCDGVDNDCDGRIDEEFTESCDCWTLGCRSGVPVDTNGNGCADTCLEGPFACEEPPPCEPDQIEVESPDGCHSCMNVVDCPRCEPCGYPVIDGDDCACEDFVPPPPDPQCK